MESMREKYETLQVGVLRDAAKRRGLKGISTLKKSELIELMLKEDEKERQETEEQEREPAGTSGGQRRKAQDGLQSAGQRRDRLRYPGSDGGRIRIHPL